MFKLQNLLNIILFCVPHKIQTTTGLAYNKVDIPLIQFYRPLDIGNTQLDLSKANMDLHF